MRQRLIICIASLTGLAFLMGCSASGAGHTSFSIGKNLFRKDSNLRIYLDGHEATQSKLKKGLTGYAAFKIDEPVSTSPTFRYEFIDVKKPGFIKSVSMQVHPKYEADFSDIPDYVIVPEDREHNMKPQVDYDLGNLGPGYKILDRHDNEVDQVEFKPGVEYLLVFTVQADQSESVQIFFKTS